MKRICTLLILALTAAPAMRADCAPGEHKVVVMNGRIIVVMCCSDPVCGMDVKPAAPTNGLYRVIAPTR